MHVLEVDWSFVAEDETAELDEEIGAFESEQHPVALDLRKLP